MSDKGLDSAMGYFGCTLPSPIDSMWILPNITYFNNFYYYGVESRWTLWNLHGIHMDSIWSYKSAFFLVRIRD